MVDDLLDCSNLFPVRESFEKSQLRLDQFNKLIGLGILQLSEKLFYGIFSILLRDHERGTYGSRNCHTGRELMPGVGFRPCRSARSKC